MQGGHRLLAQARADASALLGPELRPLLLAFASCGGAAAYLSMPAEPPFYVSLGVFAAISLVLVLVRQTRRSDGLYTLMVLLFGLGAGFSAAMIRAHSVAAPVISEETRPVMLEGWVTEVEPGQNGPRLRIKVHAIAGFSKAETPVTVRLTHTNRLEVFPGRFVRCWAVLRPPPAPSLPGDYDFRRQAYFEQLGAVGYVRGRCRGGVLGAPENMIEQVRLRIASKRRLLAEHVNTAAGERAGGLAAALITGDRSFLRHDDQEALRNTGLAHLLAISGLHLSIVGGLTYLIMRRGLALIEPLALRVPVQKLAAATALAACAAYLVMSGAGISTQRAFIMAAIVFTAVLFDRSAISLRTFSIAMMGLLFLWPESVVTPGFQMSFAATGALIVAYDAWRAHRSARDRTLGPLSFGFASIVMTSVVSDAATSPYALYHFDRISPVGLAANLSVMPVVTFITAPLAAIILLLLPFGAGDAGLRLFGYSLEVVLGLAHTFHDLSPGLIRVPVAMPAAALVLLSLSLAAAILVRGWTRLAAAALFFLPALWVWQETPKLVLHWSASGAAFLADDAGYMHRASLVRGQGLSPLRFQRAPDLPPCEAYACSYLAFAAARITLEPEAGVSEGGESAPRIIIQMAPGTEPGTAETQSMTLEWPDVTSEGGISVYLRNGELVRQPPPACGQRIWSPCREAERPPAPQT